MENTVDLLPGGLKIVQNPSLYRFTSDSILLSRFARHKAHDVIADFCAGSGIVGLHFYALHGGDSLTFVELQRELASLCEESVALSGLQDVSTVLNQSVQSLDSSYAGKFSLVLCNPPYERAGFEHKDEKKALCKKEITLTFSELARAASRALKFGGRFAFCHRADRLAELIYTLKGENLEPKRLAFVAGREGDKPYLLLMEAVKGGKEGMEIFPTLVNKEN